MDALPVPDTYTVAGLSDAIGRAITTAFPDQVWVRGEIRDLQRPHSGHVFFALVDPDDDRVRIPVALFVNEKRLVNRVLMRTGAVRMTDGVEVRIRGEVVHYAVRGSVQIRMTLIDPDYTVGRLAAERARVLQALAKEGLLTRNAEIPMPLVPLRIGLVTSRGSAAEADFLATIEASPYGFDVLAVDARVQGVDAVPTLLAGAVDVVAIVRGGGSATDLAAFDDEQLARRIALMRTPVVTGIGHEIDRSVADEVAALSHKTPTEAAAALVAIVVRFDEALAARRRSITDAARRRMLATEAALETRRTRMVESARRVTTIESTRLDTAVRRITTAARRSQEHARRALQDRVSRLVRTAPQAAERAGRDLGARSARVAAADPVRLLRRGWSITRTAQGNVVRDPGSLEPEDVIVTRVADGEVTSGVTGVRIFDDDDLTRGTEQTGG
jgi:exodeoxyribonuclease VII large subunit